VSGKRAKFLVQAQFEKLLFKILSAVAGKIRKWGKTFSIFLLFILFYIFSWYFYSFTKFSALHTIIMILQALKSFFNVARKMISLFYIFIHIIKLLRLIILYLFEAKISCRLKKDKFQWYFNTLCSSSLSMDIFYNL
jgi:hypothetical protein